ncbi:MAG TPA: hypothetical protein VF574_01215 [Allosphingosinicella sp.]|jgi:sterol desaturase/sphingolipid hydroxylase (fatty acid hydroxylase superfamily)
MNRTRSQILQRNEKAKAWSTIIGNLATTLAIAGFGMLWLNGLVPWPIVWIAFGFAIMMFATELLTDLEAES